MVRNTNLCKGTQKLTSVFWHKKQSDFECFKPQKQEQVQKNLLSNNDFTNQNAWQQMLIQFWTNPVGLLANSVHIQSKKKSKFNKGARQKSIFQLTQSPVQKLNMPVDFNLYYYLNRLVYFGSCYIQHHAQTIRPTEKYISMNLLQMSCVITWA